MHCEARTNSIQLVLDKHYKPARARNKGFYILLEQYA